jgi:hypothetical protein
MPPSFPAIDRIDLPCVFERLVPGRLHPDGRRYLPLVLLRLSDGLLLGVTDRHHLVDAAHEGRAGSARLVFLLSSLQAQRDVEEAGRRGLWPEPGLPTGRASTAPTAAGQVLEVPSWELGRGRLPYETLYAELVLDIGLGTIGVRTNLTAPSLAEVLGREPIAPGDWIEVRRSRIDILGFHPRGEGGP